MKEYLSRAKWLWVALYLLWVFPFIRNFLVTHPPLMYTVTGFFYMAIFTDAYHAWRYVENPSEKRLELLYIFIFSLCYCQDVFFEKTTAMYQSLLYIIVFLRFGVRPFVKKKVGSFGVIDWLSVLFCLLAFGLVILKFVKQLG